MVMSLDSRWSPALLPTCCVFAWLQMHMLGGMCMEGSFQVTLWGLPEGRRHDTSAGVRKDMPISESIVYWSTLSHWTLEENIKVRLRVEALDVSVLETRVLFLLYALFVTAEKLSLHLASSSFSFFHCLLRWCRDAHALCCEKFPPQWMGKIYNLNL